MDEVLNKKKISGKTGEIQIKSLVKFNIRAFFRKRGIFDILAFKPVCKTSLNFIPCVTKPRVQI